MKKFTYLLAIPAILFLGSCATSNQTAQKIDQHDDVYYSEAKAKEKDEVIAQAKPEVTPKTDYVTDEQLYRDGYGNVTNNYYGDYAGRINRFRNYTPWRGYYNNFYGNYLYSYNDPFYSPYNYYSPGINLAIGINGGYYNYNPWRYYGYNYSNNYWGPYSYYNSFGIGYGNGYYGGNSYYCGGYGNSRPVYTSPNYRPRPTRSSDGVSIDRGSVNGNPGGVITNGNGGNVIQSSGSRAERYNGGTTPSARPQATAPRPERVQQREPQRNTQPERVSSAPPSNNNGGGRSGDSGNGGSSSGARPSRGN